VDGPLLARVFLRAAWSLAVICLACECGRTWTAGPDRFRGLRPYQFVGISLPGSPSLETPRVFLDPSVDGFASTLYCPREVGVAQPSWRDDEVDDVRPTFPISSKRPDAALAASSSEPCGRCATPSTWTVISSSQPITSAPSGRTFRFMALRDVEEVSKTKPKLGVIRFPAD
jgi:hypothetical protein